MILNIVINNGKINFYKEMYEVLSPFYAHFKDEVDTYFVEYSTEISSDFLIADDVLYIKGVESMMPGLLQKTLDAILIFKSIGREYTHTLRTNVSTVVNIADVVSILKSDSGINYFAGYMHRLNWLDPVSGINNSKWFGTYFASGTLIAMSNELISLLLDKRHKLHFDLIDDVAIGVFLREYWSGNKIHHAKRNKFLFIENKVLDRSEVSAIQIKNSPLAWRNKSADRSLDVKNMKNITSVLLSLIVV